MSKFEKMMAIKNGEVKAFEAETSTRCFFFDRSLSIILYPFSMRYSLARCGL